MVQLHGADFAFMQSPLPKPALLAQQAHRAEQALHAGVGDETQVIGMFGRDLRQGRGFRQFLQLFCMSQKGIWLDPRPSLDTQAPFL